MPDTLAAAQTPTGVREPRFLIRRLQRIEIPVEPGCRHEYRVRFTGQRSFIRANRQQAEQALALGCGEVIVDVIASTTQVRA